MVQVCPTCGGVQVGCPTCNAPPKRILPKSDIYKGKLTHRKMMARYGAPIWEVTGIDISKWNGQMNFAITKTKCQYVYMRYGYGSQWKDPALDMFYAQARNQGMPVGAYWFCYDDQDPVISANSFADLVIQKPVQLDVVGDFERTYKLTPQQTLDWINKFDDILRGRLNKVMMPYSSAGFWDAKVARSTKWKTRQTWAANWTVKDYPTVPIDWTFKQGDEWQWRADGNLRAAYYGSTGGDPDMDEDRYYGSVEQFNVQYPNAHITHIGEPPAPPLPPGTVPKDVIITIGELAIHDSPLLVQTNIVGHALINTVWHPFEERIVNGGTLYRVTQDGWISKYYTKLPG